MFLMIQSIGEAPIESFTILGLSTARYDEAAIGQFGSGAKHATLLLLRNGINPQIYCGRDRLQFFTKPATMGDHEYHKVFVKQGNAKAKETSMSLEFGELDWDNVGMALREYISNAIDASGFQNLVLDVVDKPRAKAGVTRIFVELTPEVQRYYNDISSKFLHFSGSADTAVIRKETADDKAKIYRKGVFVRQISYGKPSLFDYNLGDDLKIDEARNLDDWAAKSACAKVLSQDTDALADVFKRMIQGVPTWESTFSEWNMECNEEVLRESLTMACGHDDAIVCDHATTAELLDRKGYRAIILPEEWVNLFRNKGVCDYRNHLSGVETKGQVIVETRQDTFDAVKSVWHWLVELELHANKEMPKVASFNKHMDAGTQLLGYYEDNTVFINTESPTNKQTILEELAHYITGATDNSRDFQDFAFKVATHMGELIW
jgi:hypothetical protein